MSDEELAPPQEQGTDDVVNQPVQDSASPAETPSEDAQNPQDVSGDDAVASGLDDDESLPREYRVQPGDSLVSLAEAVYGDAGRAWDILAANTNVWNDPGAAPVGSLITLPE